MLSLNPFKKSARTLPDEDRCTQTFANGRRCRNPIAHDSPNLCAFHRDQQAKAESEAQAAAILEQLYGEIANLDSEAAVAHVLANLFRLIAEDRIPPRRASLLASTARAILRALKDHHHRQRNELFDAERQAEETERQAEEEKSRQSEAEFKAWARSFGHPQSSASNSTPAAPPSPRAQHATAINNPASQHQSEHSAVAPHSSAAAFAAFNSTASDELQHSVVAAGLDRPGSQQPRHHENARELGTSINHNPAPRLENAPAGQPLAHGKISPPVAAKRKIGF